MLRIVRYTWLFLAAMLLTSVVLPPLSSADPVFVGVLIIASFLHFVRSSVRGYVRKYETTAIAICVAVTMCFYTRAHMGPGVIDALCPLEDVGTLEHAQSLLTRATLPWFDSPVYSNVEVGFPFSVHSSRGERTRYNPVIPVFLANALFWSCAVWKTWMLESQRPIAGGFLPRIPRVYQSKQ